MEKILYDENLRKEHNKNYNQEKIQEEINKEISEKGFSVFEIDEQILFKTYYENDLENKIFGDYIPKELIERTMGFDFGKVIAIITITIVLFLSISFVFWNVLYFFIETKNFSNKYLEIKNLIEAIISLIIFGFSYFLTEELWKKVTPAPKEFKFLPTNHITKFLKNKYILVTESRVFIESQNFVIKNGEIFENPKIKEILFPEEKYFYKIEDEKEREKIFEIMEKLDEVHKTKTKYLKLRFKVLDDFSKEFLEIEEEIMKNIEIFELYKFQKILKILNKKVEEAKNEKEEIKKDLSSSNFKNFFDLEKYENYLKKTIVFPLKGIKEVLEKQVKYSNYLTEKTKNMDSEQIELSHKRLENQKKSLQRQILLLDEKIKILEK